SLMEKMRLIKLFLGAVLITVTLGTSCNEQRGCTDQYSDNFDSSASQDDDTCIPTTSKFEGEYLGQGQDGAGNQYEDIRVFITDSTATEPLQVLIFIENFDLPTNSLDGNIVNTFDIEIPTQTISGVDPFQYEGSGSLSGRVLTLDFVRSWYDTDLDTTFFLTANFYALKEIED
ncbi:MAG: hypothetical protein ACI97X_000150, partial [Oceanospirillaceae bacterium]